MLKLYSATAVCVLAVLLLAGCGSKSAPAAAPSTKMPSSSTSTVPSSSPSAAATAAPGVNPSSTPQASENPVAPEKNPVGDIPDTQAFVKYSSAAGGYSLQVPEGWSRKELGGDVSFSDKLNGVKVSLADASEAPTVDTVKTKQAADLVKNGRAVKIDKISEVNTPGGKTIKVVYSSNSEPDAVTEKKIRLENEAYYYFKNNKVAVLTVWAPLGADNVDQWKKMSDSFGWDAK